MEIYWRYRGVNMEYNCDVAIMSLIKLVTEANIREIDIGRFEKTEDKYDLIVTGNELYTGTCSRKLKKIGDDTRIIRRKYIVNKFDTGIRTLIDRNCDNAEVAKSVLSKIESINSNKNVAVMFKDGTEIEVTEDGKVVNAKIRCTEFTTDSDGNIRMKIIVSHTMDGKRKKPVHLDVGEYNKTFNVNSSIVNDTLRKYLWASDVIKILDCGFISTICVNRGKGRVVIDNSYAIHNNEVIGEWDADRLEINCDNKEIIDIVKKVEKMIAIHRKYIIPYGFCDINIINLEE